ncbi:MAG: exo-alpha-sialidase [Verrucomicrobia bacterium]|nr:exo-alpha-sialidase [Verrucomicrobiota bacterium]
MPTQQNVRSHSAKVKLQSVDIIYHDGKHNAFTGIVRWKGQYWVCFRNAAAHRALDGKILVMSSPDLKDWGTPSVAIDTPEDNRDPKMFVLNNRLYVTSMTIKRSFEMPETCEGKILTHDFFSLVSHTEDGIRWSEPQRVWEPFKGIWWAVTHGNRAYGSGYVLKPVDGRGNVSPGSPQCRMNSAEFIVSDDGLEWKTLSVISQERQPTECALAFLPDERAVAFVRHEEKDAHFPEIKIASPPYTKWETIYDFPFWTNGACLGLADNTLVAASRAFLEPCFITPEIARLADPDAVRGLLVMTIDVDKQQVEPQLVISCPPHPKEDWPDVSYAGIIDLGEGQFAMSFYDGLKMGCTDIKLARLVLCDNM